MRILLFIATNLAVIAVLSLSMRLLGIDSLLDQQGIHLNLQALLIYAAIIGFSGSFISLFISKWSAKKMTRAEVITTPKNNTEKWLLNTVKHQATQARIACPEVAIYPANEPNAFATGMNKNNSLVAVSSGLLLMCKPKSQICRENGKAL